VTEWLDFNEEVFFFLLLPPIIFESGYSLQTRDFFNNFGGICGRAVADVARARHVIGCHLTQDTRVQTACRRSI